MHCLRMELHLWISWIISCVPLRVHWRSRQNISRTRGVFNRHGIGLLMIAVPITAIRYNFIDVC